jgi:hypothetical protein
VHSTLDVDRNIVDEPVDDLSAPESVRSVESAFVVIAAGRSVLPWRVCRV